MMAIRFTCNCKGKYHDYGSLKKLRQHEKTATHKSFIDPVFAEAERQRKKDARPTIKCCVEACEYSSSDPSHLHRHEKVCKVKAENILTGGNFSGYGARTFFNGNYIGRYVGNFRYGEMHGEGIFTFDKLGDSVTGVFSHGELNGLGTHTFLDGEMYVPQLEPKFTNSNKTAFIFSDIQGIFVMVFGMVRVLRSVPTVMFSQRILLMAN